MALNTPWLRSTYSTYPGRVGCCWDPINFQLGTQAKGAGSVGNTASHGGIVNYLCWFLAVSSQKWPTKQITQPLPSSTGRKGVEEGRDCKLEIQHHIEHAWLPTTMDSSHGSQRTSAAENPHSPGTSVFSTTQKLHANVTTFVLIERCTVLG